MPHCISFKFGLCVLKYFLVKDNILFIGVVRRDFVYKVYFVTIIK